MINNIRQWLVKNKTDAILVPMKCSFDNYDADKSDIALLSGFTGSNGRAIITKDHAILTVDGRYVFQAEKETDKNWTIKQYPEVTINKMILSVVQPGQSIAVTTTAQTYSSYTNIVDFCDKNKIFVKNIEKHPVLDYRQQKNAISKLVITNTKSINERIAKIVQHDTGLLIANKETISWIFGIRKLPVSADMSPVANAVTLLIKNEKPIIFCDLQAEINEYFDCYHFEKFDEIIAKFGNIDINADFASIPAIFILKLLKNNINVIDTKFNYQNYESIKDIHEIKDVRYGCIESSKVFAKVLAYVDYNVTSGKKITEDDAVKIFQHKEAINLSFNPISASANNTSYCHYNHNIVGNSIIQNNALFLFDAGFHFNNSSTDMTRTIYIGENPLLEYKKCYTTILKAVIFYSLSKFFDNTYAYVLDSFCRYHLWQEGYNYHFSTGHGVGCFRSVHEWPSIGPSSVDKITANMVTTVEPGYYTRDFGIRLENMLLSVKNQEMLQFETLTFIPFCKKLIIPEMLDQITISWLNNYNKQIRNLILPTFTNDLITQNWILFNTEEL